MIEYFDDKQQSQLDDRFYRPARFSKKKPDSQWGRIERMASEAYNAGFFDGIVTGAIIVFTLYSLFLIFR